MKKKTIVLAALAAVLAATMCVDSALAYFTTYTAAKVRGRVSLEAETKIEEKFESWTKTVSVSNEDADAPVYIRAAAYGPSGYPLTCTLGDGWSYGGGLGDGTKGILGYFYYKDPVEPGEDTTDLTIKITGVPSALEPEGNEESSPPEAGESFDVTVIYEKTAVIYDADGNPIANDAAHASEIWGTTVDTSVSSDIEGAEEEDQDDPGSQGGGNAVEEGESQDEGDAEEGGEGGGV